MTLYPTEGAGRAASVLRWGMAGLLVAAAHAGAGWWVVNHRIAQAAPPDAAQAIMVDLEPIAVAQNAPEPSATLASGLAPTPQATAAPDPVPMPDPPLVPEAKTAPSPPTPEPAPPEPAPPTAVATPPVVQPPPEPPLPAEAPKPPDLLPPKNAKIDAILAPPSPRQVPRSKPQLLRPDSRKLVREAAERKAVVERREARRAAARAQAQAQTSEAAQGGGPSTQAAAPSSAASGASVATWRGQVVAHLNGFKPAAPDGASGTARVAFSVDRSGRVVTASLAISSGNGSLDAAAVSMVRRASPVPPPPPDLGGRISLSVPVRFY